MDANSQTWCVILLLHVILFCYSISSKVLRVFRNCYTGQWVFFCVNCFYWLELAWWVTRQNSIHLKFFSFSFMVTFSFSAFLFSCYIFSYGPTKAIRALYHLIVKDVWDFVFFWNWRLCSLSLTYLGYVDTVRIILLGESFPPFTYTQTERFPLIVNQFMCQTGILSF